MATMHLPDWMQLPAQNTLKDVNYGLELPWSAGLRLVRGMFGVVTALAILALAFGRIGGLQSASNAFGLERCGDRACFRSLMLGQTSWEDALAAFNGRKNIAYDPPNGRIALERSLDNVHLGRLIIGLNDRDGVMFNAGEIVILFGPPCRVAMAQPRRATALVYPFGYFNVSYTSSALQPETPVREIVLVDPSGKPSSAKSCQPSDPGPEALVYSRPWRGF